MPNNVLDFAENELLECTIIFELFLKLTQSNDNKTKVFIIQSNV